MINMCTWHMHMYGLEILSRSEFKQALWHVLKTQVGGSTVYRLVGV